MSIELQTEVLSFIIQSSSGSYGFAKYNSGKQRHFFVSEEFVSEDFGSKLPEENEIILNEKVFVDDIFKLVDLFGINLKESSNETTYSIKTLEHNQVLKDELAKFERPIPEKIDFTKKPWWKFW